jgi:hypothetical protein
MSKPHFGTWYSYAGAARVELAVGLLVLAAVIAFAGTRLTRPARAARPGRAAIFFLLLSWVLALVTFLVCLGAYAVQIHQQHLGGHSLPADPIAPVTALAALATFFIVLATNHDGFGAGLVSAIVAAAAGPMIFELPFDLIVMSRTYPPIPPHPALYRALFFLPLFIIEILTLWLLTLSARMKVSRPAFYFLAAMFGVFAIWALFGMAYPSAPAPIALNMVSKILAFATVVCLFLPLRVPTKATADATAPDSAVTAGTPVSSPAADG